MSGGSHIDPSNKKVALIISVLALLLAISETLGKTASSTALEKNIEASNLWSFFQAKSIRMTTMKVTADSVEASGKLNDKQEKLVQKWRADAARYDSEPETGEGRKELMAKAKHAEEQRDLSTAATHQYEMASAAIQIAIVLASTSIVIGVPALLWGSAGLGLIGLLFLGLGWLAPTLIHI
jgi:hypothetical protein